MPPDIQTTIPSDPLYLYACAAFVGGWLCMIAVLYACRLSSMRSRHDQP